MEDPEQCILTSPFTPSHFSAAAVQNVSSPTSSLVNTLFGLTVTVTDQSCTHMSFVTLSTFVKDPKRSQATLSNGFKMYIFSPKAWLFYEKVF